MPFSDDVRIASFTTRDYLGLIYAYLGEGEPPPFPRYPDLEDVEDMVVVYPYYVRSCNYFQNIENGLDPVHLVFTHHGAVGSPRACPTLQVEETEWGITGYLAYPNGEGAVQYFGMPNIQRARILPSDPEISSNLYKTLIYKVPVDDENHLQFLVIAIPMAPDATSQDRERAKRRIVERCNPRVDLVLSILAGNLQLGEVKENEMLNQDLVWLQDDVVQIGQGVIVDRHEERLGQSDVGILMIRRLWEREMRALAERRPLKHWIYAPVSFEA